MNAVWFVFFLIKSPDFYNLDYFIPGHVNIV
jgi:hypothetical protein